jgi:hypothetical protein
VNGNHKDVVSVATEPDDLFGTTTEPPAVKERLGGGHGGKIAQLQVR